MNVLITKLQKNSKNGQTTVEFAIAAIVLLGFLFAIIDLSMLFYVRLTMQHAVREGTRYAITGQIGGFSDRRTAMIAKIREQSMGLYDKNLNVPKDPTVKVITPSSVTFSNYTGGVLQTTDPGKRDEIIVVSLTYKWRLTTPFLRPFFNGGISTFTVKSTMKNEPFPSS